METQKLSKWFINMSYNLKPLVTGCSGKDAR